MLRTWLPEHRLSETQKKKIQAFSKDKVKIDFLPKNDFSTKAITKSVSDFRVAADMVSKVSQRCQVPHFQEILDQLRSDMNVPLLFDRPAGLFRSWKPGGKWSNHDRYLYVTAVAWTAYCSQVSNPIDFKIYASTPHGLANYIEARVLENLGVKLYIFGRSILSGYAKVYQGIGRNRKPIYLDALTDQERTMYENDVHAEILKFQGAYSKAIPWYEKKRADRLKGRVFSLPHTLLTNWRNPSGFFNSWACWRALKKMTKQDASLYTQRYVVIFLQFQPERTSLPESWGFAQQYDAIHIIRRCLPSEVSVLVREHPSTFRNRCDERVRSPKFYAAIDAIPGVSLANIHDDPYDVIDNAQAVVTLTGTVGTEALARGVPAVFLGTSLTAGCEGLHCYKDEASLQKFFSETQLDSYDKSKLPSSLIQTIREEVGVVFPISKPLGSSDDLTVVAEGLEALLPVLMEGGS